VYWRIASFSTSYGEYTPTRRFSHIGSTPLITALHWRRNKQFADYLSSPINMINRILEL